MKPDAGLEIVALIPRLRRFARTLAGSPAAADDLVQATCERALAGIDGWQQGTRLDSWMFRILRNLWIDDLRRRRPETTIDDAADISGDDGRRIAHSRLELDEVRAVILALPDAQREVLALICIEDMSYRETAEILNVPMGTVMSRLARARKALLERLEDREFGVGGDRKEIIR